MPRGAFLCGTNRINDRTYQRTFLLLYRDSVQGYRKSVNSVFEAYEKSILEPTKGKEYLEQ